MRKEMDIKIDHSLFIVKNNDANSIKKFCISYIFNLFLITSVLIRDLYYIQIIYVSRRVCGLISLI